MLFAEVSGPVGMGRRLDPEELRLVVGGALTGMIAEVEGLGGTVTAVSGAGLVAIFGAPEAHEDDPERAVRAGGRILSTIGLRRPSPCARCAVCPCRYRDRAGGDRLTRGWVRGRRRGRGRRRRAPVGGQSGSVLVGPVTRAATEGAFEWGRTEEVVLRPGTKPLVASYLERPKARPLGYRGRGRWAGAAALVGHEKELAVLDEIVRATTSGTGSVLFIVGEPGLGKTRLVQESRKRFMAWVGAGTGRLPLWLEGGVPRMHPPPLTAYTSSSFPLGSGPLPRRARRWSAPPWSGP